MNLLSRMALRGRIITIIATVLVMAGGVFSLTRMQVELFPDIDFPLIVLVTLYPQAGPESVLQDVTIPLEDAFSGLDGLDTIRSTSSSGFSLVVAEYEFGIDMGKAAREVEERLQTVTLPVDVQPPRVARVNASSGQGPSTMGAPGCAGMLAGRASQTYALPASRVSRLIQLSNVITCRAISPLRMPSKASLTSSSGMRPEIISSSLRRPSR